MDPFTGLGSTGVACARLGLDFVGVDIDDTYLKEAVDRVQEALNPRLPGRGMARMKKATLQARSAAAGHARLQG